MLLNVKVPSTAVPNSPPVPPETLRPSRESLSKLMEAFVTPLYAFRARRKGYEVSVMKEMMNLVGLAAGPVRPPLPDVRPDESAELREMLKSWKPWL